MKTERSESSSCDDVQRKALAEHILRRLDRLEIMENEKYPASGHSIVTALSDIEETPVTWFWAGRIPNGKLTIVDGDPGVGKSIFLCYIAALASKGNPLPGETEMRTPNLILLLSEDDPEDTIKPRVKAMGGNMQNVLVHRGVFEERKGIRQVTLAEIGTLRKTIETWAPDLVVIDPIISFSGKVNTNSAFEVREMLWPIAEMAKDFGCAIVALRHLNKDQNKKALYKGQGSMDFLATARSAFLVEEHPQNKDLKIFYHIKCNNGPSRKPIAYSICESDEKVGYVKIQGEIEISGDNLDAHDQGSEREPRKLEVARVFLLTALKNRPVLVVELKAEAAKLGIKERTLERAKEVEKIKATKKGDLWFWTLPEWDE